MRKTILQIALCVLPFLATAQETSLRQEIRPIRGSISEGRGSVFGLKTNIPYWGTGTFNLGGEVRLARHWTFDAELGLNPFDGKKDDGSYGKSLKHLRVHPEMRYWFCESFINILSACIYHTFFTIFQILKY